jgi:7-cyano-7-deazaguanine synthase in queuosine biosynthesis
MAPQGSADNRVVAAALHKALDRAFPRPATRRRTGLVMLSGGLDSVALLVNLLQETDQQLYAHHIELQNFENRRRAENEALEQVLAYCRRHYRPFSYSTSRVEFPLGRGGGFDLSLVLFTAARVHTALGCVVDAVYTGHLSPTRDEIVEGSAVLNACYISKSFKPRWLWPLAHLKKVDVYRALPRELAAMTWSCRRPVAAGGTYRPCGRCHTCRSLQEVARLLASETGDG